MSEAIAVVGYSGRFPGAAGPDEFWENLIAGHETIRRFSAAEAEYSVASPEALERGERFVRARGILENPDLFDASFFGIYPREAAVMDPQHRVFLECAWEAVEAAGYDPFTYPGMIGVYAGTSLNTYLLYNLGGARGTPERLAGNYQVGEYTVMLGNDKDFLPVRTAYKLNLRGPAMAVQSACSTSLVAICQACTALQTWQCDMALAGGVSITFPQMRDYRYVEEGMVSEDGTCRAFDAEARGTVFGHGCAVVLLKRLSDALSDRDTIHAVLKGWAVNNDGAEKIGFAAPAVQAQAEVIALAQAAADISPASISYIEAHGTGTPLGDPIEVAALTQAFREGGATENGFCAIGTGKTHIGHLDVASGATGLIKTILQLRHERIPALLHFQSPNPRIPFSESPFFPVAKELEWKRGGEPRRAGVSAFGVGGTNAHVVVEEPPALSPAAPSRPSQVIVLSARTPAALARMSENLAGALGESLADAASTLAKGRREFPFRRALVAAGAPEAASLLRGKYTPVTARENPPVAFLFPGQGAQQPGMGRALYASEAVFRNAVDACAEILLNHLGEDIRKILFPGGVTEDEAARRIHETVFTQPAIFVIEYALSEQWRHWGIRPSLLIGHSIGEYVAAVVAGVFSLEQALLLLSRRARLMQSLPGGSMLAVRFPAAELHLPAGLSLAAVNSPQLTTVSGPEALVAGFQKDLELRKIPSVPLRTSHAFHSGMMDGITGEFAMAASGVEVSEPLVPWISTLLGREICVEDLRDGSYWARQLRETVRFFPALEAAGQEFLFLECGPGRALGQFARQSLAAPLAIVHSAPGESGALEEMQSALGSLWCAGAAPDWDAYFENESRRRVPLPTYPFERESFWIAPVGEGGLPADDSAQTGGTPVPPEARHPQILSGGMGVPPVCGTTLPIAMPCTQTGGTPVLPDRQDGDDNWETEIASLLTELSGHPAFDPESRFVELGFDSLFLTQLSQAILTRYGVKVTFRELLGDVCSVSKLAGCLREKSPAGKIAKSAAPAESHSSGLPPVRWPDGQPPAAEASPRFGPYKPIERGSGGGLTDRQRAALDDLIGRYVKRTSGSKAYTAAHRPHYADPRAVAGFNPLWKEMVYPIVSAGSHGSHIVDLDGNSYVDVTMGFGTYFFGHSPDWLVEALKNQLSKGIEIGPQSATAGSVARDLCQWTGMDRATFCNTGSEAVMAAIRLARTVTGRQRVAYFAGDYHGMFDEVLVRGAWVDGVYRARPIAPGIPESLVENMLVLDYASPASLEILRAHAGELAAVLVEPVQSRRPALQPRGFLHELRAITRRSGIALVFDEVVTGFRCHPGGAQAWFGIEADMATYGKVIGAGVPIGILTGKKLFMDALDGGDWSYGDESFPEAGMTFFAGTFVRHPLAMAAARAVLDHLHREGPGLQLRMNERTAWLCRTLTEFCVRAGAPVRLPFFSAFAGIEHAPDLPYASLLWYYLREKGIHIWEGRPLYFTTAHSDEDLDAFASAFCSGIEEMQEAGFLPAGSGARVPGVGFPRADRVCTTEAEREVLSSVQMGGDDANRSYNESNTIHFVGPLDIPALEKSLLHVVQRHPALRSTFSADGAEQIFHPAPERWETGFEDLSALSEHDQDAAVAAGSLRGSGGVFDLVRGPLVWTKLFRIGADRHVLIFTAHHLVCDGWSFGMIVDELSRSYGAFQRGVIPLLPPPLSFADYARSLQSAEPTSDREYWLEVFRDIPAPLDLPCDRPRPLLKTFHGGMEVLRMEPERFARLKKAAPGLGGTVFSTLLAVFATLLHRLSGREDLVIGVPSAGQTLAGCDQLVGHCLNFLPLRLHPSGSFREFSSAAGRAVLSAYEHQSETFGSLLRALKVPRDASRLPLVSVMFNIDRSGFDRLAFEGLEFSVATNPKQFVNFDIFFNLQQTEENLEIECEYNTDLFDAPTIRRWLAAFETLVEGCLVSPGSGLLELPVLGEAERAALLSDAAATARPYDREVPVHAIISKIAADFPDKTAVIFGERRMTYSELEELSSGLAARLEAGGVRAGDLVGLCMERSEKMVAGLLGILKAGAAYVPMDPAFPAERLAFMCEDARMPVLVAEESTRDAVAGSGAKIFLFDREPAPQGFHPSYSGGERPAYVMFTSGSTGRPKGVVIPHRALANFLHAMRREPGLEADDTLLAVTTLSFDISGLEIFLPLTAGATVVIASKEAQADGNLLAAEIKKNSVSVMQATPATWRILLDSGWGGSPGLKALVGGEAVPRELVNRLVPVCASVWNVYGPTETTIWSTTGRLARGDGPVLIGRPIDNTRIYIVNPAMRLQPPGVVGEMLIGGDGLALGYLGRDGLTAEKFVLGPVEYPERVYRTGDLAKRHADGTIECLGRMDNQVKVRGFRIELGEIEAELEKFPGILQAVAHVHDGRLIAYLRTSSGDDLSAALRGHLAAALPDYMIPAHFIRLDAIPQTPNGKVDRRALPAPEFSGIKTARAAVPPATDRERRLLEIWRQILGLPDIGIEDDIFELGGDSLLIFQISTRATAEGLAVRPAEIFLHRTISAIAAHAGQEKPAAATPAIQRLKRDAFRRKA